MLVTWNQSIFLTLNQAFAVLPDWLWSCITICGHTAVMYALFAPLLRSQTKVVTALLVTTALGGITSHFLKAAFSVLRPPAVLAEQSFHLIGHRLDLVSFPSGHSLTAFAVATLLLLGLKLHGWRAFMVVLAAVLIGLSRIAVGAHWPLDVVGGASLGILLGWLGWLVALRLEKTAWHSSRIYPSVQALLIGLTSASLFWVDLGYPMAHTWQLACALIGCLFSAYSVYSSLKSFKFT